MEATAKSQRTNRTHRKNHDATSNRDENQSERDLSKSFENNANASMDHKFSVNEVEYHDPQRQGPSERRN